MTLSPRAMRAGHTRFWEGRRDPETLELERAYNAWRHRLSYHRRRAQRMGFAGCGCLECATAAGLYTAPRRRHSEPLVSRLR